MFWIGIATACNKKKKTRKMSSANLMLSEKKEEAVVTGCCCSDEEISVSRNLTSSFSVVENYFHSGMDLTSSSISSSSKGVWKVKAKIIDEYLTEKERYRRGEGGMKVLENVISYVSSVKQVRKLIFLSSETKRYFLSRPEVFRHLMFVFCKEYYLPKRIGERDEKKRIVSQVLLKVNFPKIQKESLRSRIFEKLKDLTVRKLGLFSKTPVINEMRTAFSDFVNLRVVLFGERNKVFRFGDNYHYLKSSPFDKVEELYFVNCTIDPSKKSNDISNSIEFGGFFKCLKRLGIKYSKTFVFQDENGNFVNDLLQERCFKDLGKLEYLFLERAKNFRGTVMFTSLKNLRFLRILGNERISSSIYKNLPNLSSLFLQECSSSLLGSSISSLTKLEQLVVEDPCSLIQIKLHLKGLKALKKLGLRGFFCIDSVTSLSSLQNLEEFSLNDHAMNYHGILSGFFPKIKGKEKLFSHLKKLTCLKICQNNDISGNAIQELNSLQKLFIRNCPRIRMGDKIIVTSLVQLRILYLEKMKVNLGEFHLFQSLSCLRLLEVETCGKIASTSIVNVQMYSTKVSDPQFFSKIPNLRYLILKMNIEPRYGERDLINLKEKSLSGLKKLEILVLKLSTSNQSKGINDNFLKELGFSNLKYLKLVNCYFVKGKTMNVLHSLEKLKIYNLFGFRFDHSFFKGLPKLKMLDVFGCSKASKFIEENRKSIPDRIVIRAIDNMYNIRENPSSMFKMLNLGSSLIQQNLKK